jgi:hypothetical protein
MGDIVTMTLGDSWLLSEHAPIGLHVSPAGDNLVRKKAAPWDVLQSVVSAAHSD